MLRTKFQHPLVVSHLVLWVLLLYFSIYTIKTVNYTSVFLIMALFTMFIVFILFMPVKFIYNSALQYIIFLFDIIVTSAFIYITHSFTKDFYLVYFLIIFTAALNKNIKVSLTIGFLASIVYAVILLKGNLLKSEILMRVPFLFLTSIIASFFAEESYSQTKQINETRKFSRILKDRIRVTTDELHRKESVIKELNDDLSIRKEQINKLLAVLNESENKYKMLINGSDELIFTLNDSKKFTTVNNKIYDILGYRPAEILGKDIMNFISNGKKAEFINAMSNAKDGKSVNVNIEMINRIKKVITLNLTLFPVTSYYIQCVGKNTGE